MHAGDRHVEACRSSVMQRDADAMHAFLLLLSGEGALLVAQHPIRRIVFVDWGGTHRQSKTNKCSLAEVLYVHIGRYVKDLR